MADEAGKEVTVLYCLEIPKECSRMSFFLWNKVREWQVSSLPSYLPEMIEAFVYLSGANDDFSLSDMRRPWCLDGEPRSLQCRLSVMLSLPCYLPWELGFFPLPPGVTQTPIPLHILCLPPWLSPGHGHRERGLWIELFSLWRVIITFAHREFHRVHWNPILRSLGW